MAGNQNSGGFRPTAPQNNPANINAMGGNGQSGQAVPDYTGFAYGQNQAIAEQAASAPMAKAAPAAAPAAPSLDGLMGGITPLDAPTGDNLPISDGVDFGAGRGTEALPGRVTNPINQSENLDLIKKYLPDLMNATRVPGAPDSYKQFVNYLKSQIL